MTKTPSWTFGRGGGVIQEWFHGEAVSVVSLWEVLVSRHLKPLGDSRTFVTSRPPHPGAKQLKKKKKRDVNNKTLSRNIRP